jgi:hypothetical protein
MDSLYTAEQSQAEELRKRQSDLEKQRKDLDDIRRAQAGKDADADIKKACGQRERHLLFHESNLKERVANKQRFLLSALENYLLSMESSKKAGHLVFRVLHLWFDAFDDPEVNRVVLVGLKRLTSCKEFLIIVPQVGLRVFYFCDFYSQFC